MDKELNAVIFVQNKLLNVISSRIQEDVSPSLTTFEREQMRQACKTLKTSPDLTFHLKSIQKTLCSQQNMPLEYIWLLNVFQILPLDFYMVEIVDKQLRLSCIVKSLTALIGENEQDRRPTLFIISGLLSYLVNRSYGNHVETDERKNTTKKVCRTVLDNVLNCIFCLERQKFENQRFCIFNILCNCGILQVSAQHSFYEDFINFFLCLKPPVDVFQVFQMEKIEPKAIIGLDKCLQIFDIAEIINCLKRAINDTNTNWKSFLEILQMSLRTHEKSFAHFTKLVEELLAESFQQHNKHLLTIAFLLGRNIIQPESVSLLTAGRIWFQKHFTTSATTLAKTADSFSFLIQVLTELVPHESSDFLKVPLECPPSTPPECRSTFLEYASLVKTRLKDLKPPERADLIVDKVLQSFQQSNKIPPAILGASVLQRHQFQLEFLPHLLKPRKLPSQPDTRMKFIDALKKAGKISQNTFQKYEAACQACASN